MSSEPGSLPPDACRAQDRRKDGSSQRHLLLEELPQLGPHKTPQPWGSGSCLSFLMGAWLPSASPAGPKQHLAAADKGCVPAA